MSIVDVARQLNVPSFARAKQAITKNFPAPAFFGPLIEVGIGEVVQNEINRGNNLFFISDHTQSERYRYARDQIDSDLWECSGGRRFQEPRRSVPSLREPLHCRVRTQFSKSEP
jgi:hypothetical protein